MTFSEWHNFSKPQFSYVGFGDNDTDLMGFWQHQAQCLAQETIEWQCDADAGPALLRRGGDGHPLSPHPHTKLSEAEQSLGSQVQIIRRLELKRHRNNLV